MAYHHQLPCYGSLWGQKEMTLAKNLESVSAQALTNTWTVTGGKQVQCYKERNLALNPSILIHAANELINKNTFL